MIQTYNKDSKTNEMANQTDSFKKIAEEIYKNRGEHEQEIKKLFVNTEILTTDAFYKNYQQEINDINSEITPSKDRPSIADFKEIFNSFEKYPSNLQKPKKVVPKELNRTMAITRAHSVNEINNGSQNTTIACSPQTALWEPGPTVSEIYLSFREFKQNLNKLLQEVEQTALETEYINRLQKLNSFTKDIEKLCGTDDRDAQQAFTDEESAVIRRLAINLEKALYIDANRNLFQEEDIFSQQQQALNLDNVLELLTYWFNAVGHYKEL